VIGAAATAAAIPLAGLAAPSSGYPDLRSDPVTSPGLERSGSRLLLRFDGFVTNVGGGPLDVTGNPSVSGGMKQRVNQSGSWSVVGSPPVRYETADGHNHFHLMNAMRYSLWTSDVRAEVAPAQKVGFCLYDLAQVSGAPVTDPAVYAPQNFCQAGNPGATSLSMGVSAGWRDVYNRNLALQWVDVSNTSPGAYQIAAESDPNNVIVESNEGNNGRVYRPFTIPGHVARAVGPIDATAGRGTTVALAADAIGSPGGRALRIESAPAHGSLNVPVGGTVSGDQVVYTPAAGYSGPDSFTFSAATTGGPTAGFPLNPPRATATLRVAGGIAATVAISGAPARMVAGTSARLTATVAGAGPGVTWSASAGTVSPDGLYVAPAQVPPGGAATVQAASIAQPGAAAGVTIAIDPVPAPRPAVGRLPGGSIGAAPASAAAVRGGLARSTIKRDRRTILLRTVPLSSGRLNVAAIRGGEALARCRLDVAARRRATCLMKVPPRFAELPVRVGLGLNGVDGTRATARLIARAG